MCQVSWMEPRVTGFSRRGARTGCWLRWLVGALALIGPPALTAASAAEEPAAQSREQPGTPPAKDQPAAQPKGQPAPSKDQPTAQNQGANQNKPVVRFDIDEYRIEGADHMAQIDVEEAVYPFLGPGRSAEDVEKARAALEKAYQSKGYQTVAVSIPEQNAQNGIVVLKVVEAKVARLRVKGSRYFDIEKIKDKAPSVAEGKLPNLNEVTKDIIALNQLPDRKVTPALRAGLAPGTVDVDLNVEDKLPLHASVELANRQSPNTKPLRLSTSGRYDNLWQRGDSVSFSYQVAPERPADATVYSGSYLARTDLDWLNILLYAVDSKSNVSSVGGANIVGPGRILGTRGVFTLPMRENFFHTVSVGIDAKHFEQTVTQAGTSVASPSSFASPVTYYPIVANYTATLNGEGMQTVLNAGVTAGLRGLGSLPSQFDNKRFGATTSFFYLRGDLTHTRDLPGNFQFYGKVQGQLADQPLVSSEQFTVAGADYVRGYLESEVIGDSAIVGTVELRTPKLGELTTQGKDAAGQPNAASFINDWRIFAFLDGGEAILLDPLPQQQAFFRASSFGVGSRIKLFELMNGMIVIAVPRTNQGFTAANKSRLLFRVSGEF
jgi:hemolysin activation/secretion protein